MSVPRQQQDFRANHFVPLYPCTGSYDASMLSEEEWPSLHRADTPPLLPEPGTHSSPLHTHNRQNRSIVTSFAHRDKTTARLKALTLD